MVNYELNEKEEATLEETACDEYEWNGEVYTESGIYTDSLQNIEGCDSIVNLDLTIYELCVLNRHFKPIYRLFY